MSFDSDNFTGTPSDQINGRTSSGGNTWVADSMVIVASGTKAGLVTTGNGWMHSGAVPSDDDYIAEADFTFNTLPSINTTNHFLFSHGTPTTRVERIVGGIMLDGSDLKAMCRRRTLSYGDFDIGVRVTATFATGIYRFFLRVSDAGSNIWNVTLTIIRASDGFYLNSSGTWQSGAANVISTTWDDSTLAGAGAPLPAIGRAGIEAFDLVSNVDYDNFVARYPGGISLNPSTVVKGSINNAIAITGDGTAWTPGTPGTPTFTAGSGTIQSQTIASSTTGSFVYDAQAGAGDVTITDPSSGFTATLTVTEPETLVGGTVAHIDRIGSITIECQPASGGTPTFTYEWQLSDLAEGTFAAITGQTSVDLEGYTPVGSELWFRRKVTDHASVVAYSNVVPTKIDTRPTPNPSTDFKNDPTPMVWGFIGDSIGTTDGPQACVDRMASLASPRDITLGVNGSESGTTSANWASGQARLSTFIANCLSSGVTHVNYMLGANDPPVDVPTYLSHVTGTVADVVAAGLIICLHPPTWPHDAWKGLAGTQLMHDYRTAQASLHNGTTVFYRDDEVFFNIAANPGRLADSVHPTSPAGATAMGQEWGDANLLSLDASHFTLSPPTIPANHSGEIEIVLTGAGTTWLDDDEDFATNIVTKTRQEIRSNTDASVWVTTSATTGTLTISETVGSASDFVNVSTATVSNITPATGLLGSQPTLVIQTTNMVLTQEIAASLLSITGGVGASLGLPTIDEDNQVTVDLVSGAGTGTLTIAFNAVSGLSVEFGVAAATSYTRSPSGSPINAHLNKAKRIRITFNGLGDGVTVTIASDKAGTFSPDNTLEGSGTTQPSLTYTPTELGTHTLTFTSSLADPANLVLNVIPAPTGGGSQGGRQLFRRF